MVKEGSLEEVVLQWEFTNDWSGLESISGYDNKTVKCQRTRRVRGAQIMASSPFRGDGAFPQGNGEHWRVTCQIGGLG